MTAWRDAAGASRRRWRTSRATAGVSLATVDRVVNRREGVRAKTVARVEAAVAKLGYRADAAAARLARKQTFRFAFMLPTGANTFMTNLTEQVQRTADWLAGQRGFIDILHVDVFDPDALAGALETLSPAYRRRRRHRARSSQGARRDRRTRRARGRGRDPGVRRAELAPRCTMSASTIPAAGRTAATLMGRFLRWPRGDGRRHRGLAVAARSCRAAVRLPPDPVQRISRTCSRCRRRRPRRQRAHARAHCGTARAPARPRRHLQRRRRQPGHRRRAGGVRPRPRRRLDRA